MRTRFPVGCVLAVLAAAPAAAGEPAGPGKMEDGKIQAVAKELSDLLRLTVADRALAMDRKHWAEAAKSAGDAAKKGQGQVVAPGGGGARIIQRRLVFRVAGGIALNALAFGLSLPEDVLFQRVVAAAGCSTSSFSSTNGLRSISATGEGLMLAMQAGGDSFGVTVLEQDEPGRLVRLQQSESGKLRLVIAQPGRGAMLTLDQAEGGRLCVVDMRDGGTRRFRADSFLDLHRDHGRYVDGELIPLLRHMGVVLSVNRFSPAVVQAVLSLLRDPLTPQRVERAKALIADLDCPSFAKREAATKLLTEDCVACYPLLIDAQKQAAETGGEAHQRLTQIVSGDASRRQVCQLVHVGGLLKDTAYLVALLGQVRKEDRPTVAAALKALTGQDHGEDPAAWRRWAASRAPAHRPR